MGLFDFAADFGKKLFSNDEDAAKEIQDMIERDNPGILELGVKYDDGAVELSGKAGYYEMVEKAVLMAGNVKGVTSVNADNIYTPPPPEDVKIEYYTIVSGDTLGGIAKRFLGNAMDYPKIFEANREVIKDPDKIYPGQKIRIPLD